MMADDAVSSLLQQYYGVAPDTLGGDVQPRVPRPQPYDMYGEAARPPEQLGQHNLMDRALAAPGQPSMDVLQRYMHGAATPQETAWAFLENGPLSPFGLTRAAPTAGIRAFHGTHAEVGPNFRFRPYSDEELGPHFGTAEQANSRLSDSYDLTGSSVIPVNLRLRNPLEIRDPGQFDPFVLPLELERTGRFTPQEIERLSRYPGGNLGAFWEDVSQLLQRHGYDSIRYRNVHENPAVTELSMSGEYTRDRARQLRDYLERHGDYSYMPLAPNTVFSATTGNQLYGAAPVTAASVLSQYGGEEPQQ